MSSLSYTLIVYLLIIIIAFYALKFMWKKSIFGSIALSLLIGQIFLIVFSPAKNLAASPENPTPTSLFNSYELLYWAIQIVTPMIVYAYVIYTVFIEKACYYVEYQ
jgi:hypothetical protein